MPEEVVNGHGSQMLNLWVSWQKSYGGILKWRFFGDFLEGQHKNHKKQTAVRWVWGWFGNLGSVLISFDWGKRRGVLFSFGFFF